MTPTTDTRCHNVKQQQTYEYGVLPATGYVREKQLIGGGILPFSAKTLWRKVKDGTFVQPVKLGERITAWKVESVREWLDSRV